MTEKPKTSTIECVVMDITTKELLQNSIIGITETNNKYTAVDGTLTLILAAGNYSMVITKADYIDYTAKLSLKPGSKSKLVFNLRKTEEVLKSEAAAREREKTIKNNLDQGKIYFLENKLDPAKIAFEMVLSLDPGNGEAKEYLTKIEPKRLELIATYTEEAKTRTNANDFAKAIEAWQKVLSLNSNNSEARSAIAELQNRIVALKKPPEPPKPIEPPKPKITAAEIEVLYKKGISLFTAEKYDEALKIFKQVLAYDPKHTGAKDYKNRTEARIKALGGG